MGTKAFTEAVKARLGKKPETLPAVTYREFASLHRPHRAREAEKKELVGVDVFIEARTDTLSLQKLLEKIPAGEWRLMMISNRGVNVWPHTLPETFCIDTWRCRYQSANGEKVTHEGVAALLGTLAKAGLDFVKTEHLYTFDGTPGF